VSEGVVLERALATLVADRAVQRVVDQLVLQDVGASADGQGCVGPDHHAFSDRGRAAGLRLGRPGADLHQAEPASSHRIELVGVAEDRALDDHLLGGLDDQCAPRYAHRLAVDRQGDQVVGVRHGAPYKAPISCGGGSGWAVRLRPPGPSAEHWLRSACSSYSLGKYCIVDAITCPAESPRAQRQRPYCTLSWMRSRIRRSMALPSPARMRSYVRTAQ